MIDLGFNYSITDSNLTFHLDSSLVKSWLKHYVNPDVESNEGIYLKPELNTGSIVGYEAFTAISTNAARLNIAISKTDAYTDTISGFIIADVSLADGNLPTLPPDNFGLQSSISVNGWLSFDLSPIPVGAVINSAELILTRDTLTTKTGSSFSNSLRALFVTDSTTLETSDGSDVILSFSDNQFKGNITSYVRRWVNDKVNNGLILQPFNQIEGVELFGLKNSSAEFSARPRLKIVYSIREGL
jgi:hypothetical protein